MDRTIIFGSSGNIGAKIYTTLSKRQSIHTSSRKSSSNNANFIKLDLVDKKAVDDFADKYDRFKIVIFLTGLAHNKGLKKDFQKHERANYLTLKNLLESLKDKNKIPDKIIFASTIAVYGERMNKESYTEELPLFPRSPYALTKKKSEEYLLRHYKEKSWILRLAPVYDTDFQLNINRRTLFSRMHYKVSDGRKKLSLCNMRNVEFCIESIIYNMIPPSIYNVSDKNEYNYNDLLKYKKADKVLQIPRIIVKFLYFVGKLFNNNFPG